MILSTFIVFNDEDKERIDRLIDDEECDLFFSSELYSSTKIYDNKICFIGFESCSKIYSRLDILTSEINNNTQWLFSYEEEKNYYHKNIIQYINNSIELYVNKFQYEIVDYFFISSLQSNTVSELLTSVISSKIVKSLQTSRSLYFIMQNDLNTIFNISLKMIKYYNGNEGLQEVIDYFQENSSNHIPDDNHMYFNKIREVINFECLDDVLLERYLITLI